MLEESLRTLSRPASAPNLRYPRSCARYVLSATPPRASVEAYARCQQNDFIQQTASRFAAAHATQLGPREVFIQKNACYASVCRRSMPQNDMTGSFAGTAPAVLSAMKGNACKVASRQQPLVHKTKSDLAERLRPLPLSHGRLRPLSRSQAMAKWGVPAPVNVRPKTPPASTDEPSASARVTRVAQALPDATYSSVSRDERLLRLVSHFTSPAGCVDVPSDLEEVPRKLDADTVGKVLIDNVPGVQELLFRQKAGEYCLKFIKGAYADGLRAYSQTDLHHHFLWHLRLIVHNAHEGKPGAARFLQEVAEAFMDCQAVQARVIESVGLQIRGVSRDFRGLLLEFVTEYRTMALRMLSYQECIRLGGPDENNDPTHYDNRIIVDIGKQVGFNAADLKRAHLDTHAHQRFRPFTGERQVEMIERFKVLFDLDAMLHALAAELNSFSEASFPESLPRQFMNWAPSTMTQPLLIFDEDTCSRIEVSDELLLPVFEVVCFGRPACSLSERYRTTFMSDIFK